MHRFIGDNVYTKVGQKEKLSKIYIEDLVEIPLTYFLDGSFNNARHSTKEKKRKKKRLLNFELFLLRWSKNISFEL